MTISFISIQENIDGRWQVVQKTFPQISRGYKILSVNSIAIGSHYIDRQTAELAAKIVAVSKKMPYVTNYANIITVTSVEEHYWAVKLKPNGSVTSQKICDFSYPYVVEKARTLANHKNLQFIPCKSD